VSDAELSLAHLAFRGQWRRYQELALEAFQHDLDHGRWRTNIVAPPGSGKTLLGVEITRRLAAPALVLVPNTAVQAQWLKAVREFGAGGEIAGADVSFPLAVLTYQALCQLDDPAVALGDLATRRWTAERAQSTGQSTGQAEAEAATWTGEAARRRDREVRRISAGLKREIARAEHGSLELGQLLSNALECASRRCERTRSRRSYSTSATISPPFGAMSCGPSSSNSAMGIWSA
jgi:hypothetical protein